MTKIRQPVSRNAQVDTRAGWRREKKERKSEIVMAVSSRWQSVQDGSQFKMATRKKSLQMIFFCQVKDIKET